MRSQISLALSAMLAATTACADRGRTVEEAAASINEADYMHKLAVIADDSMMGRDTPSEGLDKTAQWIATEFERYGLEPGGDDGSFLQRWPYPAYAQDWDATTVEVDGGPALTLGEELAYIGTPMSGEVTGGVVVVAVSQRDLSSLAESDVEGRHVLVFPGSPMPRRITRVGRFLQEPAGVFIVSDLEGEAWDTYVADQRESLRRIYGEADLEGPPTFAIRRDAALALLEAAGMAAPSAAGAVNALPVPGISLTVTASARKVDDLAAPNVVGILRGSDPELRNEYVVFSGHMDHVGVNPGRARQDSVFDENGQFVRMETDSIFNGADDDASGTIAVVEVAEAFSMLARPPRRSMIFLTVSGEEKGLLGSRWFVNHPTVPIEDIVADFNTDMIGRNWTDTVVVIGKEHSELGQIMNQVGATHPELDMAPIDDRWPDENFYTRSDHFNFARRGVPVLFFFTGTHDDYHQATDEVRKIEGDKAARIAKLVFYLSEEVANMDHAPMWYDDSYDEYVSDAPEGAPRRSRPREGAAPSN